MMHRFESERKGSYGRNIFISLAVFGAFFFCFWFALSSVSGQTDEEEIRTLRNALTRSITQCYAIEGNYPASLEYLKTNYGLYYDEETYFIDYQPVGSNIMPDVTIIKKGETYSEIR